MKRATMSHAAFALPLPVAHPVAHQVQPFSAQTCRRCAPTATFSIPLGDNGELGNNGHYHSEETKRKIGASVERRAQLRRRRADEYLHSLLQATNWASETNNDSTPKPTKPTKPSNAPDKKGSGRQRRPMSAESRAKISAALKGRAKSAEHRANLRKRFEGSSNPMYGRKLSEESRAKISAAMSGKKKKKDAEEAEKPGEPGEEEDDPVVSDDTLEDLREKAITSRLLGSKDKPVVRRRNNKQRRMADQAEAEEVERILKRVADMNAPPESVVKTLRNMEERRAADESSDCAMCGATGYVQCPACAGQFGVASAKCETCFGAGALFCHHCDGVGRLQCRRAV